MLIAVLSCAAGHVSLAVLVTPSLGRRSWLGTQVSYGEADAALAQAMLFWGAGNRASRSRGRCRSITATTPKNELELGACQAIITGLRKQTCLVQLQSVALTACHPTSPRVWYEGGCHTAFRTETLVPVSCFAYAQA